MLADLKYAAPGIPTPVVESSTRTMPNDLGMDHTEWIWDAGTGACSMYSSAIPPR
ncbi:MAG: hypothetical protein QOE61_2131 [Micromonosporaceae bacterium]|jgi:hypothetical protein|nr:hypothetical protein [Micromonosporaceae bacterium]